MSQRLFSTSQVAELCSDSRLVGYSLMTNYFPKISALTREPPPATDRVEERM